MTHLHHPPIATRSAGLLLLAAMIAVITCFARPGRSAAQTATPTPGTGTGTVTVAVRSGTAGFALPADLPVTLLVLGEGRTITTIDRPLRTERTGAVLRATFQVDATARLTYVPRAGWGGVQHLGTPVLLSPELPTGESTLDVYDVTTTAPALRIRETTLTAIAIDRDSHQLTLERDDVVLNPTDRTYIGGGDHITLRLPAPDRTVAASGLSDSGDFTLAGGVVQSTVPLRPGENVIVTRYLVGYDPAADGYRLRATAPVATDRAQVRVPQRFVRATRASDASTQRVSHVTVEGERLAVFERKDVRPGGAALVDLRGLDGGRPANPLTQRLGALAAVALALAALAGTAWWRARQPEPGRARA